MITLLIISLLVSFFGICNFILNPDEFRTKLYEDEKSFLLDVRTPQEFAQGHISGAYNIDYQDLESFKESVAKLDKSRVYYLYCRSGKRSGNARLYMQMRGYKVYDLKGGIMAWTSAGFPMVKE